MSHTYARQPYSQVIHELCNALNWVNALGITTAGRRHERYLRTIKEVDAFLKDYQSTQHSARALSRKAAMPVMEANQLVRIWKGFRNADSQGLRTRLSEVVKGPETQGDESAKRSSNRARNVAVELDLAAPAAATGLRVDLDSETDIVIHLDGMQLFIECKRPLSPKRLPQRINEAANQLRRRLRQTDLHAYGMIGLSVGQLYWPKGIVLRMSDPPELVRELRGWFLDFGDTYSHLWDFSASDRIAGVLVQFRFLCEFADGEPMTSGNELPIFSVYPEGSAVLEDLNLLKRRMLQGLDILGRP